MSQRLFILSLLFLSGVGSVSAQITLDEAINLAIRNTPRQNMPDIIASRTELLDENIDAEKIPQITLSGQATYQSAVTELPIDVPNIPIEPLSKDQYRLQVQADQLIWDGGVLKNRRELNQMQGDLALTQHEGMLEQVRQRSIDLFFRALEIRSQIQMMLLQIASLQSTKEQLDIGVENGTVLRMESQTMEASVIKIQQQIIGLENQLQMTLDQLSILTNREIPHDSILVDPGNIPIPSMLVNNLSAYQQIEQQKHLILRQSELEDAVARPKISAFAQAGYGRPGLNFLDNGFEPFLQVGLRGQWNLSALYHRKNDRQLHVLDQQKLDIEWSSYLENLELQMVQFQSQNQQVRELLEEDSKLIDLRASISRTAEVQLNNGALPSAEYVRMVNEEYEARSLEVLHELQQKKNLYLWQHAAGAYEKSFSQSSNQ